MVLDVLEAERIPVEPIVEGLPVSLAELRDTSARVDWDVYVELLARVERTCGDGLPLEEIGARALKVPAFEMLRRAGQLLMGPRHLYEIAGRLFPPLLFPDVVVRTAWLPSGRLVVTGELPRDYRESIPFFRLCHGNVAALPRLLDLPACKIEEQALSGRTGRLVLLPPPSHTLVARARRSARAVGALGDVWRGIERHQAELEESLAALRTSRHELQQLIERLPDGVLIHHEGTLRWANAALLEIFGVARVEDVVGRSILSFMPVEDRQPTADAMRLAAAGEVSDQPPRVPRPATGRLGAPCAGRHGAARRLPRRARPHGRPAGRDRAAPAARAGGDLGSARLARRSRGRRGARDQQPSVLRAAQSRRRLPRGERVRQRAARASPVAGARPRGHRSRSRDRSRHEDALARARSSRRVRRSRRGPRRGHRGRRPRDPREGAPRPQLRAHAARSRDARKARPGLPEPPHECRRCHSRRGTIEPRDPRLDALRRRWARRRGDRRQRVRHPGGDRPARLRPILHDEAGRVRHGPRSGHVPSHHHGARGRDRLRIASRRHDLPRDPAGRGLPALRATGRPRGADRSHREASPPRARDRRRAGPARIHRALARGDARRRDRPQRAGRPRHPRRRRALRRRARGSR